LGVEIIKCDRLDFENGAAGTGNGDGSIGCTTYGRRKPDFGLALQCGRTPNIRIDQNLVETRGPAALTVQEIQVIAQLGVAVRLELSLSGDTVGSQLDSPPIRRTRVQRHGLPIDQARARSRQQVGRATRCRRVLP
jgi:hypothetical protein